MTPLSATPLWPKPRIEGPSATVMLPWLAPHLGSMPRRRQTINQINRRLDDGQCSPTLATLGNPPNRRVLLFVSGPARRSLAGHPLFLYHLTSASAIKSSSNSFTPFTFLLYVLTSGNWSAVIFLYIAPINFFTRSISSRVGV